MLYFLPLYEKNFINLEVLRQICKLYRKGSFKVVKGAGRQVWQDARTLRFAASLSPA